MILMSMRVVASLALLASLQAPFEPAYVLEGDRVESEFRLYRDDLERFYLSLKEVVERQAPDLLEGARRPPPNVVVYGYQLLPPVVPAGTFPSDDTVSFRSYSWPLTEEYIGRERDRLRRARSKLAALDSGASRAALADLVEEYALLVRYQETIDQHVQYNRFWQRSVDEDRARFDQLTDLYDQAVSGDAGVGGTLGGVLGKPAVPSFLRVEGLPGEIVVTLPVDTDITDSEYLRSIEAAGEEVWQVSDGRVRYRLDIEFHLVAPASLYAGEAVPLRGAHIDLAAHLARFGTDRAVLTTGAESTHARVARAVLLGAGALDVRTVAHEIGHLLGFRDGYIRGYRDLGDRGFEILELTSDFDDIMTAPRTGRVRAEHFELVLGERDRVE